MTRPRFALGWILPVVLTLTFAADLIAHALPTEWVAFRAWEVVNRYPVGEGRFTPNRRYVSATSYGDLASLANRPDWRRYRSGESFTTDAFGFRRNPNGANDGRADDLLLGDSFAAGSGVNDDETLAVAMQDALGRRVYNGAEIAIDLRHVEPVIDRLGMTGGTVYYEYLERNPLPGAASVRTHSALEGTALYAPLHAGLKAWNGFWDVCPFTIWAHTAYKHVQNDRVLPNPYAAGVRALSLRTGERLLVMPQEIASFTATRSIDVSGILLLQSALSARGIALRVVLTPEKYTVYAPLLADAPTDPPQLYLDRVEAALRAAHVPVVNLLPALRRAAADALDHGAPPYLLDDTHWSPAGGRVAAAAIAAAGDANGR